MISFKDVKERLFENLQVKAAYDALQPEFESIQERWTRKKATPAKPM